MYFTRHAFILFLWYVSVDCNSGEVCFLAYTLYSASRFWELVFPLRLNRFLKVLETNFFLEK
ncbi:hypothetical protein DQM68_10415 [Leptospira mayottensis]|uniref:Uncharacterized protein n=2 Tax=Leptospira mayottensis TaxID=1137606 RepID=A0AA87MRP3_9LEPT|nr:hypothetical protein DQM68_10415 [Leptospira mayottensis]AXR65710.1 hypothetical protein DQM28_17345 [Leptospira mayottensis]AZQ02528.1 hypothetical protein LEP1GSC190_11275 [Leptospira mayottensis 200901116]EKS01063.1 hypothetical protein LEP1GSC125_3841 [Leptospira mayottensis 200901122]TGN13740.1 hypothetical protein EHR03_04825 [Leptospira mayottensis]